MPLLSWSRAFRRLHPVTETSKSASIAAVTGIRAVDFMGRSISFSWARTSILGIGETVYACRLIVTVYRSLLPEPVGLFVQTSLACGTPRDTRRGERGATNDSGGRYDSRTARAETISGSN